MYTVGVTGVILCIACLIFNVVIRKRIRLISSVVTVFYFNIVIMQNIIVRLTIALTSITVL